VTESGPVYIDVDEINIYDEEPDTVYIVSRVGEKKMTLTYHGFKYTLVKEEE
jgi:hypothetical protein